MISPAQLWIGIFAGCLGGGYWIYGKKNQRFSAMVSGALLCVYPWFVSGLWSLCLVGLALAAAPFLVDF